jgi:hypothetical protein
METDRDRRYREHLTHSRIFAIWVFGLLAAAIIGGHVGVLVAPRDGGAMGVIGGLSAFTCFRLWLKEPRK